MSNIVYGKNSVIEFLISSPEKAEKVYIYKNIENNKAVQKIFNLIKNNRIVFIKVDRNKLNTLAGGGNHQGVVLTFASREYSSVKDIFEKAKKKNQLPFILILDSVTDPHNFGSIIRTAEFAGVHGIIISKRNSAGLTPVVEKTSSGASFYMPIVKVSNLNYTVTDLKKEGVWIIGAEGGAEKPYNEVDYKMPAALVLGSEGSGISSLLKKSCDILVKIPKYGNVTSLNVGVSAGILIYEVINNRLKQA
ncbi:MAG: 23S rRNA (guanosine(2251)-2'-O)-methyltransferase RlmB [Armatimonadota bacterium]